MFSGVFVADVIIPFRLRNGIRMPTYRSHRNRYRLQRSPTCLDSDTESDPDAEHIWTDWRGGILL